MRPLKRVIKDDILGFLLLCFLLGTVFIWSIGAVTSIRITADGKLNGTVLWLTSLAIFWYAYETYQLKINTTRQADAQEVIMQNEFLPILEPVGRNKDASLKAGQFVDFQFRNLGKGPAKYLELQIGNIKTELEWSLAAGEHKTVSLSPDTRRAVRAALAAQPAKVTVRIVYQDIYKRKFQTEHIVFRKAPKGNNYKLQQGAWDFKRIRT